MRLRMCIRGSVRPSVGRLVGPLVRPSVFVRDGILSVADYNSTWVGVVVVVVVVVYLFHNGIT